METLNTNLGTNHSLASICLWKGGFHPGLRMMALRRACTLPILTFVCSIFLAYEEAYDEMR